MSGSTPAAAVGPAPSALRGRRVEAIVIGASAGGVEALSLLLPLLPAGLPAPVFVVLHLPRDRRSLLVEIFAPRCAVAVVEATDKEPVRAATVYFAPPDYHLLVDAGPRIALSIDAPVHFSRPSIDVLFESAADVYGAGLLAVLLTGGNQDGTAGLQAVHRRGGITVGQDPADAQVSLMPASALAGVPVDRVAPLARIAELLGSLGQGSIA